MVNKYLLPLGFIAVGIVSLFPFLQGKDSASGFKLIAGVICLVYGVGSLIYGVVKKKN